MFFKLSYCRGDQNPNEPENVDSSLNGYGQSSGRYESSGIDGVPPREFGESGDIETRYDSSSSSATHLYGSRENVGGDYSTNSPNLSNSGQSSYGYGSSRQSGSYGSQPGSYGSQSGSVPYDSQSGSGTSYDGQSGSQSYGGGSYDSASASASQGGQSGSELYGSQSGSSYGSSQSESASYGSQSGSYGSQSQGSQSSYDSSSYGSYDRSPYQNRRPYASSYDIVEAPGSAYGIRNGSDKCIPKCFAEKGNRVCIYLQNIIFSIKQYYISYLLLRATLVFLVYPERRDIAGFLVKRV